MIVKTELTDVLGCPHPIVLAPMANVSGAALAESVSTAGGFGIVGGGYGDRGWLEGEIDKISNPSAIGVGFITWRLAADQTLLDLALSIQPKAIFLSFGDLLPFAKKIKNQCLLIAQVQTLSDAKLAVQQGADLIVAQGTEAGGHGGSRATISLLPAVVDAVKPVPVIAAGGIGDGRGLAACLMLGACGVMMGSRFYVAQESLAPPEAKSKAINGSGDNTIRSSVFDVLRQFDWPKPYNLRTLKNELSERWRNDIAGLKQTEQRAIEDYEQAVAAKNYDKAPVIVGEAIDLIHHESTSEQIIADIISQAAECLRSTGKLLST